MLNAAFAAGFVLDALLEPAFEAEDARIAPTSLDWSRFRQFPPILSGRLRLSFRCDGLLAIEYARIVFCRRRIRPCSANKSARADSNVGAAAGVMRLNCDDGSRIVPALAALVALCRQHQRRATTILFDIGEDDFANFRAHRVAAGEFCIQLAAVCVVHGNRQLAIWRVSKIATGKP